MTAPITVPVTVPVRLAAAWQAFTDAGAITAWNFASADWCCPRARIDLSTGGTFSYRMEARDGSMGFDYEGTFVEIVPLQRLRMVLGPDREVIAEFVGDGETTEVRQTFTPDQEFSPEQQRDGWQAILNSYRAYVISVAPDTNS